MFSIVSSSRKTNFPSQAIKFLKIHRKLTIVNLQDSHLGNAFIGEIVNRIMVSKHFEEQFYQFCTENNIKWDDRKRRWNKPFHPKIKNIWVKSENGDFLNSIRPKEKGYYDSKFLGWELGVIKKEYCFWCGRIIEETRKNNPRSETVKFCNQIHRKAFGKVKADQEKLGKLFASK